MAALEPGIIVTIGREFPIRVGGWEAEGFKVAIIGGAPQIVGIYDEPTVVETMNFRAGYAEWALVQHDPQLLFLMFRCDHVTKAWTDMPLAMGIEREENRMVNPIEPGHGWLVPMTLCDQKSRIVRALRQATMTPGFTRILHDLLVRQIEEGPLDREEYARKVAQAYRRWRHPNEMIRHAIAGPEQIGKPFPKETR